MAFKAYNPDMFAKISASLNNSKAPNAAFSNLLRLKPGNTYTVRLLANIEQPAKTIFHYYSHGWESLATGQYVAAISPSTWGERDPIDEARFRLLNSGTEEQKEQSRLLTRRENWLANVYVISDPTNDENNGKVMMLRYGKQLHKIIDEAINGEDAAEFGAAVFDLSEDGCNLKIKVEDQGGFPTYVSSRFTSPSKIPGITSEEDATKVYKSIHDLESLNTVKSYDELTDMLNEHFFLQDATAAPAPAPAAPAAPTPVPAAAVAPAPAPAPAPVVQEETPATPEDTDDAVKAILDSMDM